MGILGSGAVRGQCEDERKHEHCTNEETGQNLQRTLHDATRDGTFGFGLRMGSFDPPRHGEVRGIYFYFDSPCDGEEV